MMVELRNEVSGPCASRAGAVLADASSVSDKISNLLLFAPPFSVHR